MITNTRVAMNVIPEKQFLMQWTNIHLYATSKILQGKLFWAGSNSANQDTLDILVFLEPVLSNMEEYPCSTEPKLNMKGVQTGVQSTQVSPRCIGTKHMAECFSFQVRRQYWSISLQQP